jgi:hypothetical protein
MSSVDVKRFALSTGPALALRRVRCCGWCSINDGLRQTELFASIWYRTILPITNASKPTQAQRTQLSPELGLGSVIHGANLNSLGARPKYAAVCVQATKLIQ